MTTSSLGGAEPIELGLFIVVGVLGGAHCLGMCGPLVSVYAERLDDTGPGIAPRAVRQLLLFNIGRTVAYATLGALLGALGAAAFDAAAIVRIAAPLRGLSGIVAGGAIIAMGMSYLHSGRSTVGHDLPIIGGLFTRITAPLNERVDQFVHGPGIIVLGAAHSLLPCPLLYPAYLYALVVASPVHGALALGALGIGTIPMLFVFGTVIHSVSDRMRQHLHRGLGASFILLGYIPISMGLRAVGIEIPTVPLPMFDPFA